MTTSPHHILSKLRRRPGFLSGALVSYACLLPTDALADNKSAFEDYLFELCNRGGTEGVLVATCTSAFPIVVGSGSGSGSSTFSAVSNTGGQNSGNLSSAADFSYADNALIEATYDQWGVFGSTQYNDTERDASTYENGFDSQTFTATLGVDYKLNQATLMGLIVSHGDTALDFDNDAGGIDSTQTEYNLFFNHQLSDQFYADGYGGQTLTDNESTRKIRFGDINYTAEGDYDSEQTQWGLGLGALFSLDSISVDTTLRYDERTTKIEDYEETGGTHKDNLNLIYDTQTIDSQTLTLGILTSLNISTSQGVIAPFLRLEATKEYENDAKNVDSTLTNAPDDEFEIITESPDRDYITVGGGVTFLGSGGFRGFIDADRLVNHDFLHTWRISAGLRVDL